MENLIIGATKHSPAISFNAGSGVLEISGNSGASVMEEFEQSSAYWDEILDWLRLYLQNPQPRTVFVCKISRFDTATPKYLLKVFRALEAIGDPFSAEIRWYVEKGDENMLEFIDDLNGVLKRIKIQIVEE